MSLEQKWEVLRNGKNQIQAALFTALVVAIQSTSTSTGMTSVMI